MFIGIDSTERALARKAIELTEKKLDSVAVNLGELGLPTMEVQRLGGFVAVVRRDIENTERDGFQWKPEHRAALVTCLDVYRGKVESLRDAQLKLVVAIDETIDKLTQISFFRDKLVGQERLGLDGIDSVTIASPGSDPVTLTGRQFADAVAEGR